VLKAPEIALLALLEIIFGIVLAWLGADEPVPSQTVLAGGTTALVIGALVAQRTGGDRRRSMAEDERMLDNAAAPSRKAFSIASRPTGSAL
jgi:hypothetical protein